MFFVIFDEVQKNDLANEGCRQGPKSALETSFRGFATMTVCNIHFSYSLIFVHFVDFGNLGWELYTKTIFLAKFDDSEVWESGMGIS